MCSIADRWCCISVCRKLISRVRKEATRCFSKRYALTFIFAVASAKCCSSPGASVVEFGNFFLNFEIFALAAVTSVTTAFIGLTRKSLESSVIQEKHDTVSQTVYRVPTHLSSLPSAPDIVCMHSVWTVNNHTSPQLQRNPPEAGYFSQLRQPIVEISLDLVILSHTYMQA